MKHPSMQMIPVSAVAEIYFCPRNFYYRYVLGIEDKNAAMIRGLTEDEKRRERRRIHRENKVQIRNLRISSPELGLSGEVDAVEKDGTMLIPIEYKTGSAEASLSDKVQLCAYAMILENIYGISVPYGYLYYTGDKTRITIDFDGDLRQTVEAAVEQAWDILEGNEIPPPLDDDRCKGCALADICLPDQVTILQGKTDTTPSQVAPRSTFERTVFIDEKWGKLGRDGNRMVLRQDDKVVTAIPFETFDQVFLIGRINLSGALLQSFFRRNIFVAFFNSRGRFEGTLTPEKSKYTSLRIQQVKTSEHPRKRMEIAREIVRGKLLNMRVILMRAARRKKIPELKAAAQFIQGLQHELDVCKREKELLGIEGAGSKAYFGGFRRLFDPDWQFQRRTRRPPLDPVNACLSLAYSILAAQLTGIIQAVGMDPYIGFLHREKYGKPCLALDLMEVFRPVIADSVVIRMFASDWLKPKHFQQPGGPNTACYLTEKGREIFYRTFAARMKEKATHPIFKMTLSYRRLLEMEVRFLGKYLVGEIPEFQAYRIR